MREDVVAVEHNGPHSCLINSNFIPRLQGVLNIAARAAALGLPQVGPPFIQAALAATAQQVHLEGAVVHILTYVHLIICCLAAR